MQRHTKHYQPPNTAALWRDVQRYGFNGKEVDSEGMGGGSSTYDYGFRIYNAQLGKFLSVDPLVSKFAFYTPYQFAGDKPIVAVDLDGREDCWTHSWTNEDGSSGSIIRYATDDDFTRFKSDMMTSMGVREIPSSGAFVTHQTYNSDGTVTLSTTYTPAVTIDGRGLFEKVFDNMSSAVSSAAEKLNSMGDPQNGYELDGEEGLRKYSSGLDNVGTILESTVVLAEIGVILSVGSAVIDSALDFKNLDSMTALQNLSIRVGFFGLSKKVDKLFKALTPTGETKVEKALQELPAKISSKVAEEEAIDENSKQQE